MIRMCGLSRKVILFGILCAFALVSLNCGGGGGGTASYSSFTSPGTTPVSDPLGLDSGTTTEMTVGMLLRLPDAMAMSDSPTPGVTARAMGRAAGRAMGRAAASTVDFENEYDPAIDCTMDGSSTTTATSYSTAHVEMDIDLSDCGNPDDNGKYVITGTIIVYTSSNIEYHLRGTCTPEGSSLSFTIPFNYTYDSSAGAFEPSSGDMYVIVNGTDEYGATYTNLKFEESDGGAIVTGKVMDTSGLEITFLYGTELREDGSFDVVLRTNNDIKAVIAMENSGAGEAAFTQHSSGALLLSATWDANGAGTITFANGSTETFNAES